MEAAKGVIWSREPVNMNGVLVFKYAVVLVLITDTEIPEATTGSRELHAGQAAENRLTDALNALLDRYPAPRAVGDASNVLISLDEFKPLLKQRLPRRKP